MSDQKPAQHAPEPKQAEQPKAAPQKAPEPVLGSAAESGDPVVQNLLAQRDIADRNGDKDAAEALTKRLAELGVQ